jgi:poly-gamma-glutamate capsule biosynthesis protein CapA/YwtB (metallophosphatase superfamily)
VTPLRSLAVVAVSAVAVAGVAQLGAGAHVDGGGALTTGVVVDERGEPVGRALVRLGREEARTGADGHFSLPAVPAAVATVSAEGHLDRAQVLDPGYPARVVLTRSGDSAVSLRFGGDAMMGRRFYESRDGAPAVLSPNATPAAHAAVLAQVQPLLEDADLAVLNLETPLVDDPVVERDGRRAAGFHPTKDLVIASSTAMAEGLRLAGVDVVSLANNHSADALGPGLQSTVRALDAAGVVHFGAGATPDAAWAPAYATSDGVTVAFVGCTTVSGRQHQVPYVATATTPGAAECETQRLEQEVAHARSQADLVVVMIHGEVEYVRTQTRAVRDLAAAAEAAGAAVVIGGHPHVVGGLTGTDGTVYAESMGNIVFDQNLWDTLPTYLARVDVRDGRVVAAGIDPVLVDGYRPRPAAGALADSVARIAAGTVPGSARLDAGGAHLALDGRAPGRRATVRLDPGVPARVSPGWWVPAQRDVRVGSDLLFGTGEFADVATGRDGGADRLWNVLDEDTQDSPQRLWALGRYARVTSAAACVTPGVPEDAPRGLELARSPLSTKDVIATMEHRAPVTAGEELSLLARVRRSAEGSRLEVRWYPAMSGPSAVVDVLEVPAGGHDADACLPVRLDLTVPDGMVAAQVFARVQAPDGGQTLRFLGVDDVRLVSWAASGEGGRRYDTVESPSGGSVRLRRDDALVGLDVPVR